MLIFFPYMTMSWVFGRLMKAKAEPLDKGRSSPRTWALDRKCGPHTKSWLAYDIIIKSKPHQDIHVDSTGYVLTDWDRI